MLKLTLSIINNPVRINMSWAAHVLLTVENEKVEEFDETFHGHTRSQAFNEAMNFIRLKCGIASK